MNQKERLDEFEKQHSEESGHVLQNFQIKKEEPEDTEFNTETLHHSIDIKDESSLLESQLEIEMKYQPNEQFECHICKVKVCNQIELTNHLNEHYLEKPFACEICEYRSASKGQLKMHNRLIHVNKKPFQCTTCYCKYSYSHQLKQHMKIHAEENKKPFQCTACYCKYSYSYQLKQHMKIHTEENKKPFQCTVCYCKYLYSYQLKQHMKIHMKPFVWNIFDYKCPSTGFVNQHEKSHTEKKNANGVYLKIGILNKKFQIR